MVVVDSNVFMYAAGAAHPNKIASTHYLHRVAKREIDACTSVEILDRASDLLEERLSLYARDVVHAATCFGMRVREICSYDTDFDCIDVLERIEPKSSV